MTKCLYDPQIKFPAITLTALMIIRPFHIVLMVLFLLCCAPCYCFSDSCFLKRWIISDSKGVDKAVFRLIDN